MLRGPTINLRTARETDLKQLYEWHQDLANRGEFFPLNVMSEPMFIKDFRETGFWTPERGTLLIEREERVVGRVLFYPTVHYLSELEIGYHLFDPSMKSKGVATEALRLLSRYLFDTRPLNRLRLIIGSKNVASRRIADKCGFRHEGTSRGAWFHKGQFQDVEVYALLREEAGSI